MKRMNRMPTRKSHSWWWTSHVSPKNSKWLAENLEKMDTQVKEMLKLIEEDCGDSFARKVEIYYQRRPMLITHVENFYRMYRALAERYDHVTGELRKNIPSSLQLQSSSDISESDTETRSPSPPPEPDLEQKEPQQSSSDTSESDSDFDEAKFENGDSVSYGLNQQNIELQCDCGGNASILKSKLTELEEKLEASQSEISNLQKDLEEKTHSLESLKEVSSEKEALEAAVLASKNEIEGLKEAMSSAAQQHEVELVNRGLEVEKPLRGELQELSEANASLEDKLTSIEAQLKQVEADKADASIESEKRLSELNQDTANLKNKLEELSSDKAAVDSKVAGLLNDITTREENMKQKDNHLHEMHLEHVKLIAETDVARKAVVQLHKRVYELEEQVERQKLVILDSAERKREAIRQLCFSLEHYRDGYLQLRQQLQGHRRPLVVMAA